MVKPHMHGNNVGNLLIKKDIKKKNMDSMDQYGVKFQAFLCCINCLPWHLQISTTLQKSFDRLNTLLGYCVKDPQ